LVPAGTIHAIGAGLVVAEIQQRSSATFRLFDHGRHRDLHVDDAVAVANPGPAECQSVPRRLTDARTLLVANPHFVLERIELPPQSNWELRAAHETWFLVLEGYARVGLINAFVGEAIFLEDDHTDVKAGSEGLKGLLAYVGPELSLSLSNDFDERGAPISHGSRLPVIHRATAGSSVHYTEVRP
jgi:mannose-6-phosphate isomerase